MENKYYWSEVVNLCHIFSLYEDGRISVEHAAKAMSIRLKDTNYYAIHDPELRAIIHELEVFDGLSTEEDLQTATTLLYDFADKGNKMWIETTIPDNKFNIHNFVQNTEPISIRQKDGPSNEGHNTETEPTTAGVIFGKNIDPKEFSKEDYRYKNRRERIHWITEYEMEQLLKKYDLKKEHLDESMFKYLKDEACEPYRLWVLSKLNEWNQHSAVEIMENNV